MYGFNADGINRVVVVRIGVVRYGLIDVTCDIQTQCSVPYGGTARVSINPWGDEPKHIKSSGFDRYLGMLLVKLADEKPEPRALEVMIQTVKRAGVFSVTSQSTLGLLGAKSGIS